jgi:hypothetical protein
MEMNSDLEILRSLAREYATAARETEMQIRREAWRDLHDLQRRRPLILVRKFAFHEMPQSRCFCTDNHYREIEYKLRHLLYAYSIGDDAVFEPWITLRAVFKDKPWGIAVDTVRSEGFEGSEGAYKIDYSIKNLTGWDTILAPAHHRIDEDRTALKKRIAQDAIGDLLEIDIDRSPQYLNFDGDLSTTLGAIRGIENFMVDMFDEPGELHRLVEFLGNGVARAHKEAETAMDWGASASFNQAMPYASSLEDPSPNKPTSRKNIWGYMAAQEFTGVSPAMHEEFLLRYQIPILEQFGLTAYGCCEDLSRKIDMLRKIKNLRRIAVSPFADVRSCAEQIGMDYVVSYRPSPADMVSYGLDEVRIRKILTRDFGYLRNSIFDITLKDVETVQKDPDRIRKWVALTRTIIDSVLSGR